MKIVVVSLLSIMSFGAYAADLPSNVLAERSMHVGWGPSGATGTYRFQVLKSGVVQKIDNKSKVDVLATLKPEIVQKLTAKIATIRSDALNVPTTPPCTDTPYEDVQVQQANGKTMTIWVRSGCRDSTAKDENASKLADTISLLKNTFDRLSN